MHIRKGDSVKILSGKDRGKTAKVLRVLPRRNAALVEGVNVHTKHVRRRKPQDRGQRISMPSPIHASNLMLVCASCKKPSRTRSMKKGSSYVRICVRCGAVADAVGTSLSTS